MNHTDMLSLLVPVLPADGLSSAKGAPKPPPSITPRRIEFTASAVAPGITCSHWLLNSLSDWP